ncbi:MAG TPA: GNAT family N-acetyltransferase [Bacteroidales bacterium]|nr:GNAT family N-acetyltransferase [Bacteroidales bacterium]
MYQFTIYDAFNKPGLKEKNAIVNFLYEHLDEFGDEKQHIMKVLDYAVKDNPSFGGFVLKLSEEEKILGAVIINQTGMSGYIPDSILVYIATHRDYRGKGLGKKMMEKTLEIAEGDVKLHVEPENPARFLYEKFGFTSKYIEMRCKRK